MTLHEALFASSAPVERTVKLKLDDGSEVEQVFYVRELPAIEMRKQVLSEKSADLGKVEGALSALIARGICSDADGTPAMTTAQADKLKPLVAAQLRDLIMEVNGLGEK